MSMGAIDPQGVASLDLRSMVRRLYVGTTRHCYILALSGSYGLIEEMFSNFSHNKSMSYWQNLRIGLLDIATYMY